MYKCVIIFNKELISGIQKGKLCSQAAHCLTTLTMKFGEFRQYNDENYIQLEKGKGRKLSKNEASKERQALRSTFWDWYYKCNQVKISLQVENTEKFDELYKNMKQEFYWTQIITDAGATGNRGEQDYCFAVIGDEGKIDEFTKELKLL